MTLTMRTYFRILTGAALLAMAACTPKEQAPEGLTVTPTVIVFPAGGGSQSVVVRSGENWDVSGLPQWVSKRAVTPSTNSAYEKSVEFFAAANEEYNREGVIVIKTPTKTAEISVKQDGKKGEYMAVQSISLDSTELTLTEGESSSLTWTIQPAGASNQSVSWKSSAPTVASVDDKGTVKALAVGTAVITVTTDDGNKTSTGKVTVKEKVVPATGVRLSKSDFTMRLGADYQLTATVMPENATHQDVVWSSLNPEIATVSSSGLVTAKAYGKTRIVVETVDGGYSNECTVRVEIALEDVDIHLDATSLSLLLGEEKTLHVETPGEVPFMFAWTIFPSQILDPEVAFNSMQGNGLSVKLWAIQPGTATVTCRVSDSFGGKKDLTCSVSVDMPVPPASTPVPEAVDLGISVKWASFNLGATKPEEFGDFYSWGETESYYNPNPFAWKSGLEMGYGWEAYKWYPTSSTSFPPRMTKYGEDGKTILDAEDDAAAANLGGKWRMPTEAEVAELIDKCTREWTSVNGVKGSKFTGPNGNSIFLPAGGHYNGTNLTKLGKLGQYWSSSRASDDTTRASGLDFESGFVGKYDNERYIGLPIRPVTE